MSDIPPEIIREILIRLPVKSLLRFRCVSRPWRSMIDSKYFAKLHLSHSYATNSNQTLVVDSSKLFYIDLDSFKQLDIGDINTPFDFEPDINTPFEPQTSPRSCDGLVLIVISLHHIVLWNPATRKFNKLPDLQWEFQICDEAKYFKDQYGIGYDSKHDDYKVVGVIQTSMAADGERLASQTKMYSLKSNTWKRIEDFPYMLPCGKRWGAYLNDALHGVVKDKESDVIMAFNIANEEHYEVPKPDVNHSLASVEVMGGCLTAVVPGKSNISEIWVMKEYGVKDSWTKLLCFKLPDSCLNLCPLAYSKSGDEVLLNCDGKYLNWCDLRKKTVSVPCVPGLTASFNSSHSDPPFQAEFCVGSLVSPHSPVGTRDEV